MIINLSDCIDSCQYARVSAYEKSSEEIDIVEFSFSKEGLIGFAKNLIWMYEDIKIGKEFYVCTDPLGGVPAGNQVIGFYLITGSPTLIFRINSLKCDDEIKFENRDILYPKSQFKKCIKVLPPMEDDFMEEYELGFRNLANISIYNKNSIDISEHYYEVSFEINYEGLRNLAIMLMKLADSYEEGSEYILSKTGQNNKTYDLGIVLTKDSLPVKFKCNNLGSVYDYEPKFGQ